MSKELKPCPFCGSVNIQTVILGGLFRTSCGRCGGSIGLNETNTEAITAWNTRTSDLTEELRLARVALGHADAALAGFGGDKELVEALESIAQFGYVGKMPASLMKDIARNALDKYKGKS